MEMHHQPGGDCLELFAAIFSRQFDAGNWKVQLELELGLGLGARM